MAGRARTRKSAADRAYDKARDAALAAGKSREDAMAAGNVAAWEVWDTTGTR